ncbi:MAG: hypothetical protein COZ75_05020 [Flavobacteriaceae bacterium CG_4_8_14_3_um_filter_34_10]|nr:MAG: hypothetical protein COZ75_05020 [Flavobacteriaceae bacterium CG_4_8_14_3_um_filter_34_10]
MNLPIKIRFFAFLVTLFFFLVNTIMWGQLQIVAANTPYLINFDATVSGVNEGQYAGTGFTPNPTAGQLNSNAFATTGMSDGSSVFGGTNLIGDFARSTSFGNVITGGFYAFEVSLGNRAFGFQPGSSDFTPGSVTLRLQNQTGTTIETLRLSYTVYVRNDQGRSNNVNFSYSADNISFTQQPLLEIISPIAADGSPQWVAHTYTVIVGMEALANNDFYYLRWDSDDNGGSGSRDEFAIDDIQLTANPDDLVFSENGSLVFPLYHLNGTLQAGDDLLALNGSIDFNFGNVALGNITINPGAEVDFTNNLTLSGDVVNNGSLIFKSTTTNTAQLDVVPANSKLLGNVTIQRYIPARRAFRFLSSSVTTSGSIHANWQEGAINAADNPNPGFGTHITGSTTGANGFDATPSGNPSMFTLNNTAQAWQAIANTDVNTLTAGTPYRILVRGDRSINVNSNSSAPTNTTLQATGTLFTGTKTDTNFSTVAGEFNFFGNPYPAAVDMNAVVGASTNINPNFYYVWDPTLGGVPDPGTPGGRGAYVTVALPAGTNASSSAANQYLQPGQAAFVTTLANGAASITFQETQKAVNQPLTAVFITDAQLDIRLYEATAFATGNTASDGLRLQFAETGDNAITALDAAKFFNQDENLAIQNDGKKLSIESRALPQVGEVLPLFTNQYRHTEYVLEMHLEELQGVTAYLRDVFTGEDTELTNNDTTLYSFTIDQNDGNSIAPDRFEVVFEEVVLGTNDQGFGAGFVLYPNPSAIQFAIGTKNLNGQEVTVQISNVLGQEVFQKTYEVGGNGQVSIAPPALSKGIYVVTLTNEEGARFTTKWIKK